MSASRRLLRWRAVHVYASARRVQVTTHRVELGPDGWPLPMTQVL